MASDAATRYNFSEYHLDHPIYSTSNYKALGFFKDEQNSIPVQEFVGLSLKCYAFHCTGKVDGNVVKHAAFVEKKTTKGVNTSVKEDHSHYLNTTHLQVIGL